MGKTDYDKAIESSEYTGEINRYFDENGEETYISGFAKSVLKWKWKGKKLGYFPN